MRILLAGERLFQWSASLKSTAGQVLHTFATGCLIAVAVMHTAPTKITTSLSVRAHGEAYVGLGQRGRVVVAVAHYACGAELDLQLLDRK